jgi:sulfate transport system ATP-binding protein
MEVSDRVVVMNHGRVEQVGAPEELYDEPCNEFVMSFVGRANRVGDALIRPHDLSMETHRSPGAVPATVRRVTFLGFEVRADVATERDGLLQVQTTREHAFELGLSPNQTVFLDMDGAKRFATRNSDGLAQVPTSLRPEYAANMQPA